MSTMYVMEFLKFWKQRHFHLQWRWRIFIYLFQYCIGKKCQTWHNVLLFSDMIKTMNMVFMSDTENETCIINMRIILSITTHVGSNIHTYRFFRTNHHNNNNDFKILEYKMGKKHLSKDLYHRIFFHKIPKSIYASWIYIGTK